MLNLKQDLIRQLNNIYGVSFKEKHKKEIRERIVLFVSSTIFSNLNDIPIVIYLTNISNLIIFNNNELQKLTSKFFDKYKDEMFNSFNPLWYSKEQKIILTEKEKDEMFNSFLEQLMYEIDYPVNLSRIENKRFLISSNIEKYKIKNREQSTLKIDINIIKTKYLFILKRILKNLKKNLKHLLLETETCYLSYGIKKEDFIISNLIIKEENSKQKITIFNINLGFKDTFEIKTINKIQTSCHIRYIYLNKYISKLENLIEGKQC